MSDIRIATAEDQILLDKEAKYCEANNIPHARFDTFAELPALLAKLPQGIAANATTFTAADNQELFHHV